MRFFARRRSDEDFSEEVSAHLALETDRLVADGMSVEEARVAAHRAFGNVAIARERFYESRRWLWLDQLVQDLVYAWRGMRRSPAYLATTVCTLAVGLGLMTMAFTAFNEYVLRPFAIRDPETLHQLVWHSREGGGVGFRWRDYETLSRRTDLFSAVIGEHTRFVSSNGQPLLAALVSPNYFEALGPAMQRGRGLASADANGSDVVVLSDPAWGLLFGRDPSAVGRSLDLNGRPHIIVGVLAPAFTGLGDMPRDVFAIAASGWMAAARAGAHDSRETEITLRLQPGVTKLRAEAALAPLMRDIVEGQDAVRAEVRPQSSPNTLSREVIVIFSPVFVAFGLVLATSCANVSNMMLARAIARHRELAVRLSIGASRGRIVRQLLTEGLLIACMSGLAGLPLAAGGLRLATLAVLWTVPSSLAPMLRFVAPTVDIRVFVFTLAASAAATLLFALMPALQVSRVPLIDALRGQGIGPRGSSRLRNGLVSVQVAVAAMLVIMGVTLAHNGASVGAMDIGFETTGVVSVNVRGDQDGLARPLAEALSADPRVGAVAVTSGNPLFNKMGIVSASAAPRAEAVRTPVTFVSPEFFGMLKVPIAQGRNFRADEAQTAAPVAIVSSGTAAALWPHADPIGQRIRIARAEGRSEDDLPDYREVVIVGTVREIVTGVMMIGLDHGHIYLPMTPANPHATAILVRGRTERGIGFDVLQEIFRRVVPDPQIFEAVPLSEMRDLQLYPLQAASWIASLLGAVALLLSVSGLYGVLTYVLSQRRKEIGIRMALGATARAVVSLILRQSARLAGVGLAIGGVVTLGVLTGLTAAIHLRNISLIDPGAFATGAVIVALATALAAYHPARRAARIDPAQTLHTDN